KTCFQTGQSPGQEINKLLKKLHCRDPSKINNWHHQKQTNTLLSSQRTDTQTDPTRHHAQPSPKGALRISSPSSPEGAPLVYCSHRPFATRLAVAMQNFIRASPPGSHPEMFASRQREIGRAACRESGGVGVGARP